MPAYFTHYWQREPASDPYPKVCAQAFSSQFSERGVDAGDRVYFVSYYSKRPFLVGAITVAAPPESLDDGGECIEAVPGSGSTKDFSRAIPLETVKALRRADTGLGLKFISDDTLDSQTLRGVQRITPESGQLLEQLLETRGQADLSTAAAEPSETVFTEGSLSLRKHLHRERDPAAIAAKRRQVLAATGRLACSVCGFDFHQFYGKHGAEFCEVHHIRPFSQTTGEVQTTLADLAVVCANCHRMLHREPFQTLEQLKSKIRKA